ncbi:MAG: EAL domain-containing protein (putative c-di-GMP-specific phosphodiesterase class I) [Flavobacteriales bacterium]|jgi:EAL domain-containing protein (putative c-di-GMP-specific phosphodiesterase class I)
MNFLANHSLLPIGFPMLERDWYLEGYLEADERPQHHSLSQFPYILGRGSHLEHPINGASISRQHAVLENEHSNLSIRDLDSRNGTFVNRNRINSPTELHHGDILHLGDVELRIIDNAHSAHHESTAQALRDETQFVSSSQLSENFPVGITELEELLERRLIQAVFQPIIHSDGSSIYGYESLSRGAHEKLPASPLPLFKLAESFGLEVELSELMRERGILDACEYNLKQPILVNTHPKEITDIDRLLASLQKLQQVSPRCKLILEIHEHTVTDDISLLKSLKHELHKMNIGLAFDDFGVGQSRLLELVEAKPDIIKFDKVLIENIDTADQNRVNLLKHLKQLAMELGIQTLAECVETKAEYLYCDTMGFDYYQGYYFSMPKPAHHFK